MEWRVELAAGVGAAILGLIGVVMEAQALANPVAYSNLSWLLGSGDGRGTADAMVNMQRALLPLAAMLALAAVGAYLHAIHRQTAGMGLLVTSSGVVIVAAGFAVFNATYVAILFVPAPLIVLTTVLAATASICAVASAGLPVSALCHHLMGRAALRSRQAP